MGLHLRPIVKERNSFTELLFAVAFIFAIAIFFLILHQVYNENLKPELSDNLVEDPSFNSSQILDDTGSAISNFDIYFPLLLIGIFGFVIMMAFMTESPKIFLFIGIIILGVALIVGVVFSNVYEKISETDTYSDTSTELNIMGLFMDNLPIIIFILFIAIVLILYALKSQPGGQVP